MSRGTLTSVIGSIVRAATTGAAGGRRRMAVSLSRVGVAAGLVLVLPSSVLAQSGQIVEYYHLDALGSVRVVTDQNAQVVARHDFLPFGEEWPAPQPTTKEKKLFTGHERDAETGLDYFGARYYRPQVGRFTTIDPLQTTEENLVDPQRWNRYAYVTNNPLRYLDPDGRDRMGVYEPGQRGGPAPWRGLWEEVKSIGAVAAGFVAPLFAPELATAAVGCFLSPTCQQNALEWMAPEGTPSIATGSRIASEAYETAVAGGAHAGALRNMTGRSLDEVEKAVRGYERQVAEHVDKLAHPSRYVKDWETMTSVERGGLLAKWTKDLERNRDIADVMRGLAESMR